MKCIDEKLKKTLGGLARDKARLQDLRAIVAAQDINVIKKRYKTYTTDPHAYVDGLFDPLIKAPEGSFLRDDGQQLDAMIGWVNKELCRKKNKGTSQEAYNNWDTFVQWAKECKKKVHAEIDKIGQKNATDSGNVRPVHMDGDDFGLGCGA